MPRQRLRSICLSMRCLLGHSWSPGIEKAPYLGACGFARRRSKSSARDDDGRTSAICDSAQRSCNVILQPEVAVKLKILKSRRNASLFGICAVQKENLIYCAVQHI